MGVSRGRARLSAHGRATLLAGLLAGAALAALWGALPAAAAHAASGSAGQRRYARLVHACAPPAGRRSASCFAIARRLVPATDAARAGVHAYQALPASLEAGPAGGYTPGDLAKAYGYDPSGGVGQTVAVVDAFDDPNIESDLKAFDEHYGLAECTKSNGCFRKVNQSGSEVEKNLPAKDKSGWSEEIALDVETVRGVCHGCKILLVETKSEKWEDLAAGAKEAVLLGATEVSNSYGGAESGMPAALRSDYEPAGYGHAGVVVTAATGDFGWEGWTFWLAFGETPEMPNVPASLPSVVAVGGTSLRLNGTGERESESVWNDYGVALENGLFEPGYATGGGCSRLFTAPPWQSATPGFGAADCGGHRLDADVAAVADPLTGLDVYDTYNFCGTGPECQELIEAIAAHEGWGTFGGTSLSSPLIASLYALAGGGAGLADPAVDLYAHNGDASALFDVTQGGNGGCDGGPASLCGHPDSETGHLIDCEGTSSCDARTGYDGPSGVGAPAGLSAFQPLFPTATITVPALVAEKKAALFSAGSAADPNPGASPASASWSWGDSSTGSGLSASHTYAAAGEYTISVTVTDSYGLTSPKLETKVKVVTEAEAKKVEEEEAAKHKAEEEAAKKKAEEEAAKRKAEEEAARHKAEEEAAKKKAAEEAAKKKAEEEAANRKLAEESARHASEALVARLKAEQEAKVKAEEEARAKAGQQVAAFTSTPAPVATLSGRSLTVSRSGAVTLKLSCPAGINTCRGTLTLRTLTAVIASAGSARTHAAILTLASGSFTVAAGASRTVTLHLSTRALKYFSHHHPLKAQLAVSSSQPVGPADLGHVTVTLKPAPSRH